MFTQFSDMYSGGGRKEKYSNIFIEAPLPEAEIIFYNRFGHAADRVTCTCCGADYATYEFGSLKETTKDEDLTNALIILAKDILPEERLGHVPIQGYVWQD